MNTDKLAQGLRQLGEAVYEIADALLDTAIESGREAPVSPAEAPAPTTAYEASPFDAIPDEFPQPTLADESVEFAPQGSEAVCPKHKLPYSDGKYGPFCKSLSDDPAWSNRKGYCNITPKNAAQYLRVRAAA